jgi:hypothetical protein
MDPFSKLVEGKLLQLWMKWVEFAHPFRNWQMHLDTVVE